MSLRSAADRFSAIAYSSAGFFTRLIHLDAWTMLFLRGLLAGLMMRHGSVAGRGPHSG
jgi:hypothetical protein